MSHISISAADTIRLVAVSVAIATLSACGGGGSAIPTHAAKKPPKLGGLDTIVQPYASSCSYPNTAKIRLYVADEAAQEIVRFNPPNPNVKFLTQLGTVGLDAEFDHKKNMWVSELFNNSVSEFAPPYTGTPIFTTSTPLAQPRGLAFDGANNLYIADSADNRVAILAPPYTGPASTVSVSDPWSLAFDAKCNLWVASFTGDAFKFKPPYTSPPSKTIPVAGASAIAVDSHKNLFVGTFGQSQDMVLEYAPPYTGAPVATVTNGIGRVTGIDFDVQGDLFVSNYNLNTITEYTPPYTGAPVLTLTNGLSSPGGIGFGPK